MSEQNGGPSILVVEDERIIARGIEKRLKGMGYRVAGLAGNGEEGLRKAVELRPDLILMDIDLGRGMDGIETAGLVRERLNLPVVFLTAYSDEATLGRAKLTEPFGYILKPYEDRDLQTAIEMGLYRHRMDERLRENQRWLAATLASIGDGLIATDTEGRVEFMNALAERLTGWAEEDAKARPLTDVFRIINEHSRDLVVNPALEALRTGEIQTLAPETLLVRRDGSEVPIDDSAAPIRDVHGRMAGSVLVFRDVTERRKLEEHLRQAQRMEALGRLAGGVAHDFNNIMTIILGLSDGLLTAENDPVEQADALRRIHEAGLRASELTNRILAFSRQQVMVPTVVNLNDLAEQVGEMARRLIGSNIQLIVRLAPDLPRVRADEGQLTQVILNLAANARDAMPDGGTLTVSTMAVTLHEPDPGRPELAPGRYASISLTDTGSGIPEHILPHVFEPFFTTKGVGEGTGLGLATVYGIVKQSGGHVEVRSTPDQGTTVRVYLHALEGDAEVAEAPTGGDVRGGDETILVVEDEPSIRRMVRIVLGKAGYTVLEAGDGNEALAVARDHAGPIHLLITDLVMPHISGRKVADRLRSTARVGKVLFVSGHAEDVMARQGVEVGQPDFLQKPFELRALTQKVREVLDRA